MNRYFVTVYASSADDLRRLQRHDFDLFAQTAKKARTRVPYPFSIEGLLTTGEVETLVRDGCRVLVEDPVEARSNVSGQSVEFSDWLERMQPSLTMDKSVHS